MKKILRIYNLILLKEAGIAVTRADNSGIEFTLSMPNDDYMAHRPSMFDEGPLIGAMYKEIIYVKKEEKL